MSVTKDFVELISEKQDLGYYFKDVVLNHEDKDNMSPLWDDVSSRCEHLRWKIKEFEKKHKIWCYFHSKSWMIIKTDLVDSLYFQCESRIHLKLWSNELSRADKLEKQMKKEASNE